MNRIKSRFIYSILGTVFACTANAVINPALQPDVYFQKYDNVVVLEIDAINAEAAELKCTVVEAIKGNYPVGQPVDIVFQGALAPQVGEREEEGSLAKGDRFPVFAGKPSRRKSRRQVRMYADEFLVGEVQETNLFHIGLSEDVETDSEGQKVNTLAGIYCGMTSQLIKMLEDMAADRDYYPRKAFVKFQPDLLIDELEQSVEGLAMYDLNGDGMEDIVACSPAGDRVYLQVEPMKFANMTDKLGVKSASVSCSVADVDADGLTDLLLGTTLYKGKFDKTYSLEQSEGLKAGSEGLKSASFVELNGDGFPDVVASVAGKGLSAFINSGKGVFEVAALGLPSAGNGYFIPGDWNGDAKTDLFFSEGNGYILVQGKDGKFVAVDHDIGFSFRTGMDEYGKTGAGVFVPTYRPGHMDLVVPIEKDWLIIENNDGVPSDITIWGNEISEGSDYHLATVSADLNVDGYMDIYTVCDQQKENRYIINRGYGSYMHAKVHVDEKPLFNGSAHGGGGRSVAVGDINDDGAPDILIGNEQGQVFLILNDTLSMRQEGELLKKDDKRLLNVRLCSVRVLGSKGLVNAKVRLLDETGNVVLRKDLGGNVATGCASPNTACFVVRQPGKYKLNVVYADGYKRDYDVDLTTEKRVSIIAERSDGGDGDAGW